MTYTVKLAIAAAAVFALALGALFAFAGDPSDAADKPEPQAQAAQTQPEPQAQVAPPVQANPVAAYMNQVRPLLEKSRIKLQQISNTYTTAMLPANPAVVAKFNQDVAELKATYAEIHALTPPACLERPMRFYDAATRIWEGGLDLISNQGLRFNEGQAFAVADLQFQDGAKKMKEATDLLNAAACV